MHHLRQRDYIFWWIEKSLDSNSLIVLWSTFIDQVWRACVPWSRIAVRGQLGEVGFCLSPSHGCQTLKSGCQPGEYTHVLLSHLAGPLSVVCTYALGIHLSTGLNLTFLQTAAIDLGSEITIEGSCLAADLTRLLLLCHFFKKNCWTYRVNFIFEWCQLQNNWEMNKKECIQIISLIGWSLQSVKKLMGSFYVRTWDVASLEYF